MNDDIFARMRDLVLAALREIVPELPDEAAAKETDLCRLAQESGDSLELFFFPRLRDELRGQLKQSPKVVRFSGLRGCVKKITGARRWSIRCEQLQDSIVAYLRECLTAESAPPKCALVVK